MNRTDTTAQDAAEAITLSDVYPGDTVTGFPGLNPTARVTVTRVDMVDTAVHMTPRIRVTVDTVTQWGVTRLLPQDTPLVRVACRPVVVEVLEDYDTVRDERVAA